MQRWREVILLSCWDIDSHLVKSVKHAKEVMGKKTMSERLVSQRHRLYNINCIYMLVLFLWHLRAQVLPIWICLAHSSQGKESALWWRQNVDICLKDCQENIPCAPRLRHIIHFSKEKSKIDNGSKQTSCQCKIDMVNWVASVEGLVASKLVLGLFDNPFMCSYLKHLNPKHQPPHCLE